MPRKLVKSTPPRTGAATFKKIEEILKTGTWEFPDDGKYNGSGGPGRLLEDLLDIEANNLDSPDLEGDSR